MDDELRVNPRTPRHHFRSFFLCFSPYSFAFGEVNMCMYAYVRLYQEPASTWRSSGSSSKYPMNWYARA
jgi:hypothetical protein